MSASNRIDRIINVREWDCVGDGVHDDTAALRSAIGQAGSMNGTVYLPPGAYLVSGTLTLPPNITFCGAGPWQSIIRLADDANRDMLVTADDGRQGYGLVVRDLCLDGNAVGQTTGGDGIRVTGMNNGTLRDLYILHPRRSGIHIGGPGRGSGLLTDATWLVHCELWGEPDHTLGHGLFPDSASSDAIVIGCDAGFFSRGAGIALSDHPGATVTSCNAWQNKNGLYLYGVSRCRITGCLSDLALEHGIVLQQSDTIQLTGCESRESGQTAAGAYDGVFVQGTAAQPCHDILLTGCEAFASQAGGIAVVEYARNVRIVGCDVAQSSGTIAVGTTGIAPGAVSISQTTGCNPVGARNAPPVPARAVALVHPFPEPVRVFIAGGKVSTIAIGGYATGITAGMVLLAPGESITLQYSAPPTRAWFGL